MISLQICCFSFINNAKKKREYVFIQIYGYLSLLRYFENYQKLLYFKLNRLFLKKILNLT